MASKYEMQTIIAMKLLLSMSIDLEIHVHIKNKACHW